MRLPGRLRLDKGNQEPGTFSGVPMKTWPDSTLGSGPRVQFPHCTQQICTFWELNTETHPLPRMTQLGTVAGVLPSWLVLIKHSTLHGVSPK